MDCSSDKLDPAAKVLNHLAQVQMSRKQARAQEQLSAITSRIESTLEDYESLTTAENRFADSNFIGFVDDLKRLESVLKDNLKKTEYQRSLALSITDYKQLCTQRYDLLTQLSEFFNLYSSDLDGDVANTDIYLESLSDGIQDTLHDMESILQHLDGSSKNVMSYMNHLHHLSSSKSMKNKKKLEKAIQQNKGEIAKMSEKMQKLNQDLSAREERITVLKTSLEAKKSEIGVLKKRHSDEKKKLESKTQSWEEERVAMIEEINRLRKELNKEKEVAPMREIDCRLKEIREIALNELRELKNRIHAEKMDIPEIHRELAEHFRVQLQQMRCVHEDELGEWRCELVNHARQILEIEVNEEDSLKWMQSPDKGKLSSPYHTSSVCSPTKQSSDEEGSRPDTKQNDAQSEEVVDDAIEVPTIEEMLTLKSRLQSMESMQQEMNNEMLRMQEERTQLLLQIEKLKEFQSATEADALDALKTLESIASSRPDENISSVAQTEVQDPDSEPADRDGSPSTFSKPPSPTTSRSLVSAYRQKIADRKEAMNKQEIDVASRGDESPKIKGMFDSSLLEEHLRSYRAVMGFKDKITSAFSQEAMYQSKAQILSEITATDYDATQDHVQVHVSRMSSSVEAVLATIFDQLRSIINTQQDEEDVGVLRQQVATLQEELSRTRGVYERRSQHDAAMIMHMQNTLSETQRGNTTAAGTSGSGFPSSPAAPAYGKTPGDSQLMPDSSEAEPTIMFTKQDAEHNEIALKKAATAGKINEDTLQSVTAAISAYRSIPTRRIRQLANKLVHHTTMKMIETNVRSSNLLTSEVFDVLSKMETLQQTRAQQWSRGMDEMASERRRLALLLCDAFQRLESITGVFLIKPLISFKGKGPFNKYSGKISTKFNKYEVEAMLKKMLEKKKPLPGVLSAISARRDHRLDAVAMSAASSLPNQSLNVSGLRAPHSVDIWRLDDSLPHVFEKKSPITALSPPLDVPRLLELDITRPQAGGTPRIGGARLVRTEEARIRKTPNSGTKRSSSFQQKRGSGFGRSPDFKSSVPPTTPASPQIMPSPSHISDDDTSVGGLPPIRRLSIRSSITSPGFHQPLTPSKSVPNMSSLIPVSPSPLNSSRKDMATSPVVD